ncbi:MAG: polysaccharide lyase [Actinobacteria bacterium]|nr:polysaccharide lyase [Actinomycetota bacterium]
MRRTSYRFAVAALSLLLALSASASCASGHAGERASRWRGATAFGHWAGWSKREILRGDAAAVRVDGVAATAYTVHPGDVPGKNGERSEVSASVRDSGAQPGAVERYRWATRFPASFRPVPDSTWNIVTQFHESDPDGCHPNLALQVNAQDGGERLRLTVRGGRLDTRTCDPEATETWDFAPLARDHWYRFDLLVGWSASARHGFVQLAVDGRTVVPRTPHSTLYRGQSAYLKQGLYRGPADFAATVLHTGVTRQAEAAAPAASARRR